MFNKINGIMCTWPVDIVELIA